MAVISSHRAETHSFLCLPLWALVLAALTRWFCRRREIACPSFAALTGIYAAGIALHIFLDLMTSFGTMIWSPANYTRVSWDLTFIIDFTLTATVLLPQAIAWIFREPAGSLRRGALLWMFCSAIVVGVHRIAEAEDVPFPAWVVCLASFVFGALFFLPRWHGWVFRVPRRAWCRAGVVAFAGYLGLCGAAHRAALVPVRDFAAKKGLVVEAMAALPRPPSAASWRGFILTADVVYETPVSVFRPSPTDFRFIANSPANRYIEVARGIPAVKAYLKFARFPVTRYTQRGDRNIVEITNLRFFQGNLRPVPFTYRVTLDSAGRLVEQGWVVD
jgi:hypothetical protein